MYAHDEHVLSTTGELINWLLYTGNLLDKFQNQIKSG